AARRLGVSACRRRVPGHRGRERGEQAQGAVGQLCASVPSGEETMTPQKKIAYVQAAWHTDITDHCKQAFVASVPTPGDGAVHTEFFSAPGILEIPLMAKKLAKPGRYAAVCASGFVVDGGIYPHQVVGADRPL